MLLLTNDDVKQVLTMELAIAVLEEAYQDFFRGNAVCRPRVNTQVPLGDEGKVYNWSSVEGASRTTGYFAVRLMSDISYVQTYRGVRTREKYCLRPGLYCGLILLTSIHTGEPLALIHDGYIQHVRQGADGGIGAKYLARPDAEVVGMLGSGGMARSHAEAFCAVRKVRKLKVYSPTPEHRQAYAREMAEKLGIEVEVCESPEQVYRGADILAACTDSVEPVIRADLVEPGTHLVDVGGLLDEATVRRIDVALRFGLTPPPVGHPDWVVEGDSLAWRVGPEPGGRRVVGDAAARLPAEKVVWLKDLLAGRVQGRRRPEDITYSERGGLRGVQFAAVAGKVYELARARGLGRDLPTEWFLQDIRN